MPETTELVCVCVCICAHAHRYKCWCERDGADSLVQRGFPPRMVIMDEEMVCRERGDLHMKHPQLQPKKTVARHIKEAACVCLCVQTQGTGAFNMYVAKESVQWKASSLTASKN